MNIKSLILGSAAALVAGGAVQAADLPVAEPVDYVKVCDAYGAGYFFIPGTDTCLKIAGSVTFAVGSEDHTGTKTRGTHLINMYTETTFKFTAREETELGTLTGHMEFDDKGDGTSGANTAFDKAYIMLGGFYAGLTDSLIDFNAGHGYDDYGFGNGDLNVIGYKADMGNGVTATIALEEYTGNTNFLSQAAGVVTTGTAAGTSMPAIAAQLAVSQGWGSLSAGATVYQIRWANQLVSTDLGYKVGAKAVFNIAEGLKFGIAGGYGTVAGTVTAGSLAKTWAASAGLEYAFADNFTVYLDAGYKALNDSTNIRDYKGWGTSAKFSYKPVANLEIAGKVGYEKMDYNAAALTSAGVAQKDWDDVAAKLEITRSF